jgi:hypothetical protein
MAAELTALWLAFPVWPRHRIAGTIAGTIDYPMMRPQRLQGGHR